MEFCFCYVTAGSRDEALAIGRALVEERLAACANVIEGMTSVYRWRDTIQEDREVVLIAKTRRELVDRLTARVRELHGYETPCVVALPLQGGNPAFLDWIAAETAATG
jgi:periplasmic divalent cation tolerance protein